MKYKFIIPLVCLFVIFSPNFLKSQNVKYYYKNVYEAKWDLLIKENSIEKLIAKDAEIFRNNETGDYSIEGTEINNTKFIKKFIQIKGKFPGIVSDENGVKYSIHGPKMDDDNIYIIIESDRKKMLLWIFTDKIRAKK